MQVTVKRLDSTTRLLDPADALIVRCAVSPDPRHDGVVTAIDVVGGDGPIYSPESAPVLAGRLAPCAMLVQFTAEDGAPVYVNATKVTSIRPCDRQLSGAAQTVIVLGERRLGVREPAPSVFRDIAAVTG